MGWNQNSLQIRPGAKNDEKLTKIPGFCYVLSFSYILYQRDNTER